MNEHKVQSHTSRCCTAFDLLPFPCTDAGQQVVAVSIIMLHDSMQQSSANDFDKP